MTSDDYLQATYVGGYFNTTSPITAIQFKYSAGNIDDGDIYLYGLKIWVELYHKMQQTLLD